MFGERRSPSWKISGSSRLGILLRGTDRPFEISTWQLRGGTLLCRETKDDEDHRDSDARGVPEGILPKNVLGLVALR